MKWLTEHITEGTIQAATLIGVALGAIVLGVQKFLGAKREKVPSTPDSDLRQNLAAMAAEARQQHRETNQRLDEIDEKLGTVAERTRIIVDRPK